MPWRIGCSGFLTTPAAIVANRSVERLGKRWPNLVLVHVPVDASWLNQVEIYFPVIQRKVLTPNDFTSLAEV